MKILLGRLVGGLVSIFRLWMVISQVDPNYDVNLSMLWIYY